MITIHENCITTERDFISDRFPHEAEPRLAIVYNLVSRFIDDCAIAAEQNCTWSTETEDVRSYRNSSRRKSGRQFQP